MRSPVIVVGRFAFKFARDWRGRASNLYEAKLYRTANATRRALLCPVLWVSRNGFVQSDGWLAKLREDQRNAKADVALIISQQLPRPYQRDLLIE